MVICEEDSNVILSEPMKTIKKVNNNRLPDLNQHTEGMWPQYKVAYTR